MTVLCCSFCILPRSRDRFVLFALYFAKITRPFWAIRFVICQDGLTGSAKPSEAKAAQGTELD
jgi:hypothetical protein